MMNAETPKPGAWERFIEARFGVPFAEYKKVREAAHEEAVAARKAERAAAKEYAKRLLEHQLAQEQKYEAYWSAREATEAERQAKIKEVRAERLAGASWKPSRDWHALLPKTAANDMTRLERSFFVERARAQNVTYKRIGEMIGVSVEMARHVHLRHMRKRKAWVARGWTIEDLLKRFYLLPNDEVEVMHRHLVSLDRSEARATDEARRAQAKINALQEEIKQLEARLHELSLAKED